MAELSNHEENTQRIRYEAFAGFSTQLSKCDTYQSIAFALQCHIKFILDSFRFRAFFYKNGQCASFDLFRGECSLSTEPQKELSTFENEILKQRLPASFKREEIIANGLLCNSFYNHPKIEALAVYPEADSEHYDLLISNASKKINFSVGADFKFLRLISNLLGNKLLQLFLQQQVEQRNKQLAEKNKEITFLNHTLEKRVQQRTAELSEANTELQTIFYRSTHDFRTPLANLVGLANLGEMITNDESILDLFDKCKTVVGGLDRMLFKLTSINIANDATAFNQLDFEDLVKQVCEKFATEIQITQASIHVVDESKAAFLGNAGILQTILENLLENSLTFCPEKPEIYIRVSNHLQTKKIEFSDNGPGIDPAMQVKIFDMYYRGSSRSKGHGLGLYIIKKLMQKIGGRVYVDNKQGIFTTFHLDIPQEYKNCA